MILAVYYASRTVPDSVKLLRVSVLAISVADFLICLSALYHATQTLFIGTSPASVVTGCFRNGRLCALRNANSFGFVCASLLFVSILGLVSTKGVKEMLPGSLVFMEGHIMMYLGTKEGIPYVISSCATCIEPGHDTSDIVEAYGVFVSGMNLRRANGNTWLEDMNYILWREY